ncbi:MAG: hypothetical protein QGF59_22955 [Pirellulaceae bacterium]|jgi:hypothetical protein|nr:hypothetical protein [Pirellulaceae bacterium]
MKFVDQLKRSAALVVFASVFHCVAYTSTGQESSGHILPIEPAAWINSSPITAEMLKGKAALLYFYEET